MLKCPSIATCPPRRPIPWSMLALAGLVVWAGSIGGVHAQTKSATGAIYTCTDSHGKRLTSDRLIAECLDREQRVLNKDGSQRMVIPPRMSPEERAAVEARKRELALAEAARKDAMRRDRNLLMRYPDEATHDKAREAAVEAGGSGDTGSSSAVAGLSLSAGTSLWSHTSTSTPIISRRPKGTRMRMPGVRGWRAMLAGAL